MKDRPQPLLTFQRQSAHLWKFFPTLTRFTYDHSIENMHLDAFNFRFVIRVCGFDELTELGDSFNSHVSRI